MTIGSKWDVFTLIRCGVAAIALVVLVTSSTRAADTEVQTWLDKNLSGLVAIYRELHASPELSFEEKNTAARVAAELKKTGYDVTTGVGKHGVVAVLKNGDGPTVMLRTDLDGLPVTEQTGLVYASQVKTKDADGKETGVMHACGHDLHMTNFLGTAKYLAEHRSAFRGTLLLIAQPAEERGAGARAMLADGLFERFGKPDYAVAVHVDAQTAAGKIRYRAGYSMANVNSVDITLRGRGGHGAAPHQAIDPVVMAARLVMDLQTIVGREVKPTDPAVITVGSIHAGTKHNIIPAECRLQLTVRSYGDDVRKQLLAAIVRKAKATAASSDAPEPVINAVVEGTPALFNNEKLVERLIPVWKRELGAESVLEGEQSLGGEDFSEYGRAGVPIVMFRLGVVEAKRLAGFERVGQPAPSLHSALFYPDPEESLSTGIRATVAAISHLMPAKEAE